MADSAIGSFFSSLKTERISNKMYRTRNEAKADVFDYIERFYNSKRMTVGSVYGGATMDDPQELLNTARHHCQAIQTIIDQLTETKSNTELRLLSQTLQRLAFHAAPRGGDG